MRFFIQFFKNRATSGQAFKSGLSEDEVKAWADEECASGRGDDYVILVDEDDPEEPSQA
jgi:hypothetical protein